MNGLPGRFTAPENKIIILGSVELRPEQSGFLRHIFPYRENMADIIIFPEAEKIEIRFKMRVKIMSAVHAYFIFIWINRVRLRVLVQGFYDLIKSVRLQGIVVISEHKKLSSGKGNRFVCILRYSFVFSQFFVRNTLFTSIMLFQMKSDFIVCASVRQTELPFSVGLSLYGFQQFVQIRKRSIV